METVELLLSEGAQVDDIVQVSILHTANVAIQYVHSYITLLAMALGLGDMYF